MANIKKRKKGKPAKPSNGKEKKTSSLFQRNLTYLKSTHPALASKVESYKPEGQFQLVGAGSSGKANLTLPNGQGFLYHQEDPVAEVRKELLQLDLKNAKAALFLGCGLGYEMEAFVKEMAPNHQTTHIIVVEKSFEIFYHSLKTLDYAELAQRFALHLLAGEKREELFVKLQEFFTKDQKLVALLKAMKPVYHIHALQLSKAYYLHALKAFREAGVYRLNNFGNSIEDSLIGVQNMLENINEIIYNPGINLLYDKFRGKPGIVVSTGPSLNKNKHLLKGLEDKALIVCPDASLRVLIDMAVKPHLVTALERVKITVDLIKGFQPDEVDDVFYAACPVVYNEAYQEYPGPRIIVYRNFDHFKWLKVDRGILDVKQSSGNMAFTICDALGCDPVILIGQDLAYSRDGTTHAAGTVLGEFQVNRPIQQLEVMGNDGKPIRTNATWNEFRKSYEIDVAKYRGTCINATEGGAMIHGTKIMTFQESIDQFIKEAFDPLLIIQKSISCFSKEEADQDAKKITRLMQTTLEDMQHVYDACKDGLVWLDQIKPELEAIRKTVIEDPESQDKLRVFRSTLTGYRSKVHERKENFQLFFMHIIQSFYLNFEIECNAIDGQYDQPHEAAVEYLLKQEKWFAVIGDTAMICINLLKESEAKIREKALV